MANPKTAPCTTLLDSSSRFFSGYVPSSLHKDLVGSGESSSSLRRTIYYLLTVELALKAVHKYKKGIDIPCV